MDDVADPIVHIQCSGNKPIQTFKSVLNKFPDSLFAKLLQQTQESDENGIKIYLADRSYPIMLHVINALRNKNNELILPDEFNQYDELLAELKYLNISTLEEQLKRQILLNPQSSTITVAYHATLTFGKQGMAADVNFRKIVRILVSGKMSDCRRVFGDTLNQGRDGDMGEDRYTSRVYLKHTFLEQALDALSIAGYTLATATSHTPSPNAYSQRKDETECYMHYTQLVFKKEK